MAKYNIMFNENDEPYLVKTEDGGDGLKSVEELYENELPKFRQSYSLLHNAPYESFDEIKVVTHKTTFRDGRPTVNNASIYVTKNLETTTIVLSPESVKNLIEALRNIDKIIGK